MVGGVYWLLPKEIRSRKMTDLREISSNWFKTEILKWFRRRRPCILRFALQRQGHGVYRVPGFFSSRPNWVPPPRPARKCCSPPLGPREGHTRLRDRTKGQTLWHSFNTKILYGKGLCSLATTFQHNFSMYVQNWWNNLTKINNK